MSERSGIEHPKRHNGVQHAEEDDLLCHATTRSGQPCRNRALPGSQFCRVHQTEAAEAPEEDWLAAEGAASEQMLGAAPSAPFVQPEIPVRGRAAATPASSPLASFDEGESVEIVLHNLEEQVLQQPSDGARDLALGMLRLIRENLARLGGDTGRRVAELLDSVSVDDLRSPDFWKGLGLVVRYQLDAQLESVRQRQRGNYSTDPYGFDPEVLKAVRPFANFLYRSWWRVETSGIENLPERGRALLVANHSGVLPFDGVMIVTSVYEEHPRQRLVRSLFNHWFATVPFLAPLLTSLGQVQALPENAVRLLEEDELVCTFPEGYKGAGKLFGQRYQLSRFGRGGYVRAALQTRAPLIPVAVVGAEEIYPMLVDVKPLAKLLGAPYFPITPFFPWLGPLGAVPLPTKWWIGFGEPIPTADYGPGAADDPLLVARLSDQVRDAVQAMIDARLAQRGSLFR